MRYLLGRRIKTKRHKSSQMKLRNLNSSTTIMPQMIKMKTRITMRWVTTVQSQPVRTST
jgi:hypothetical protein